MRKKLKVLYIHQYFGTPSGSWSTRAYEFARRWALADLDVTVLTAPYYKSDVKADGFISEKDMEGFKVVTIDSGDSNLFSLFKRAARALLFSIVASWHTIINKYDVVIASSGPITVGLPGLFSKWFRGSKLIFEVRDLWPEGGVQLGLIKGRYKIRMAYFFERVCYRNSFAVICLSEGMRDDILSRYPGLNVPVIPNGSDLDLFGNHQKNLSIPAAASEKKIFLYAGSLGLMDACEEIIYAAELLRERNDLFFVMIGDGAYRKDLEELVVSKGLSDRFLFTGLLPKYDVAVWMQSAFASFVLFKKYPVLSTSSPNKLFDSFAAGVPVIQNTLGWMKKMIQLNQCGLNVQPENPQSMALAIKDLLDDAMLHGSLSVNAKRLAEQVYSRDILSNQYLEIIRS